MGVLSANWLWIVLIIAMVLMHLRHGHMHGGHHGTANSVAAAKSVPGAPTSASISRVVSDACS